MIDEHEYAILGGLNRSTIGRFLAIASATLAGGIVFVVLKAVDLSKSYGVYANVPPSLMSLITAGSVYFVLYWVFSRYVWKIPSVARLLKVPNISGQWNCAGQTINPDKTPGYVWNAEIVVIQSWDKIRVRLRTSQSSSTSMTAALLYDDSDGCRLLYNYNNDPKIGEPDDLRAHRGVDLWRATLISACDP